MSEIWKAEVRWKLLSRESPDSEMQLVSRPLHKLSLSGSGTFLDFPRPFSKSRLRKWFPDLPTRSHVMVVVASQTSQG